MPWLVMKECKKAHLTSPEGRNRGNPRSWELKGGNMTEPKLEVRLELQQKEEKHYYCPECKKFVESQVVGKHEYTCLKCGEVLVCFDYLPLDM